MNILLENHFQKSQNNLKLKNNLGGALNKMKYFAVDRTEGKYTILQETQTHKIYEVKSSKLSVMMLTEYMKLTSEEKYAIRWHMGFTEPKEVYNTKSPPS